MAVEDYKHRITIELREDQILDLRNLIDWGIRSKLFVPIVDDLIEMLKKDRAAVIALLLTREIRLKDYLQQEKTHG